MDDFTPPLAEIQRGAREGPAVFFSRSLLSDYRPLQGLTIWAAAQWSPEHPFLVVRWLHFASALFLALVGLLWTRQLRLRTGGSLVALAVLFLHPLLAGPIASIDGFARVLSAAWVWLGGYLLVRLRHPAAAGALLAACFLIGLGYAEYAVSLLPLTLVWLAFAERPCPLRRWVGTVLAVGLVLVAYLLVRTMAVEIADRGTGHLERSPMAWFKALALIVASAGFFGDTCYVATHRLAGIAWLLLSLGGTAFVIASALCHRSRRAMAPSDAPPGLVGILAMLLAATFPMLLLQGYSEMYNSGLVVPMALLLGRAYQQTRPRLRPVVAAVLLAQALFAASAIEAKVAGLKDAGLRAQRQQAMFTAELGPLSHQQRVVLVFLRGEFPPREAYSVFAVPDWNLHSNPQLTLDYYYPGHRVTVQHLVVDSPAEVPRDSYDLVLLWRRCEQRFERLD